MEKRRSWWAYLTILALGVFVWFGPRPKEENSLYRLLSEPLPTARALRDFIDLFGSDQNKLSALVAMGKGEDLAGLEGALTETYKEVPEIWRQHSLFDLRDLEVGENESSLLLPLAQVNEENFTEFARRNPLANFFYNPVTRQAYFEWDLLDEIPDLTQQKRKNIMDRIGASLTSRLDGASRVEFGGPFVLEYYFQKGLRQNLFLGAASALVLALAMFLFFPRIKGTLAVLVVVFLVQKVLLTAMATVGHRLSPLSSCLLMMMTVAVVEDFVFLYFLALKRRCGFREAASALATPCFFTSLTTAIGFGSLALTNSPKIAEFALWSSIGVMFEWVLLMYVFPPILDGWKAGRPTAAFVDSVALQAFERAVLKLNHFFDSIIRRFRIPLVVAVLASFFVVFVAFRYANVGYDVHETFSRSHPVGRFIQELRRMSGVSGEFNVVFPVKIPDERRREIDLAISRQQDWISIGFRDFVPRKVKEYSPEFQAMVYRDFRGATELKAYVRGESERVRVLIPAVDSAYLASAQEIIRRICGSDCYAAGETLVLNDISVSFLGKLFDSLSMSVVLVALVLGGLAWRFDKRNLFPLLASSLWGPLAFLSLVVAMGLRINVTICLCVTVFIGLAGDSSAQFVFSKKESGRMDSAIRLLSPAAALTFLLMSCSSLVFVASDFAVTQKLAWLFPMGFVILYFGDVFVLKLFLGSRSECAHDPVPNVEV